MGSNSFLLKGWTITLTAALFAVAAKDANPSYVVVSVLPALSFWGLDAHYLRQERLYRHLYDDVRTADVLTPLDPFSLSTAKYSGNVPGWFATLWTQSVLAIHGAVVLAITFMMVIVSFMR